MFKLIGLAGKAGSGKNALANYIQSNAPSYYVQDSFAAPMKKALASILDMSVEKLEEKKDDGAYHSTLEVTYRSMLQTIGTDWGRDLVNKNIWTLLAKDRIVNNHKCTTIMTDVRFDNEVDMIHALGGKVFYIDRPKDQCRIVESHVSENSLNFNNIDYTLYNGSTLKDLYGKWDYLNSILASV